MPLAVTEFATRDALMQAAAKRMADTLTDAIAQRGSACAALSGGGTPAPAYRALSALPLDWPKITLALVDERYVPPQDAASNEGLVRREFKDAFEAGAQFKPMYAPPTVEHAADIAEQIYAPMRIDIALMGMGGDGHTASWFPGAAQLGEALGLDNARTVMAITAAQAEGSTERLTLTRSAFTRIEKVVLLITGADKRARLEAALAGDYAPVAALFAPALPEPEVFWSA
ncbi:MAG TPA: 6-phosphogluconolactonase [Candidatus Binatia bacterium]|nr:6-phosphogluconolactonase [Candidatus Binatia bacterium]